MLGEPGGQEAPPTSTVPCEAPSRGRKPHSKALSPLEAGSRNAGSSWHGAQLPQIQGHTLHCQVPGHVGITVTAPSSFATLQQVQVPHSQAPSGPPRWLPANAKML